MANASLYFPSNFPDFSSKKRISSFASPLICFQARTGDDFFLCGGINFIRTDPTYSPPRLRRVRISASATGSTNTPAREADRCSPSYDRLCPMVSLSEFFSRSPVLSIRHTGSVRTPKSLDDKYRKHKAPEQR